MVIDAFGPLSWKPADMSCVVGVLIYDLDLWRWSLPSYTDQLFEWTRMNSVDQLYSLGSQPPFNLVVSFLTYLSRN